MEGLYKSITYNVKKEMCFNFHPNSDFKEEKLM